MQPQFTKSLYEGFITEGYPDGFGRMINSKKVSSFIGYSIKGEKTLSGNGLYFRDYKLLYSGWWKDFQQYGMLEPPSFEKDFDQF